MADEFGIDLGNVMQRAEQIQAARISNRFAPQQNELDIEGKTIGNEDAALALKARRRAYNDETHARGLRTSAAGGDLDAMNRLATLDPAKAKEFHDYFQGLDEDQQKSVEETLDKIGKMIAYVKNAEDPEAAYLKAKALLTPEAQAKTPATWDPDWGDATLAQAMELNDLIGTGKGEGAPAGYRWTPEGNLAAIKGGPADKSGEAVAGGLDTAAANGIKSTVAMQFGGEYDPQTGEFSLLDRTQAERMLEVMAKAQEIVAKDGAIAPARAVQMAMEEGKEGNAMADTQGEGDYPEITTQADYDALPSGATYTEDGVPYTKP